MLANYDAKSIAEVLGLAFVRHPRLDAKLVNKESPGNGWPGKVSTDAGSNAVIRIDDDTIVIEMNAETRSPPRRSAGRNRTVPTHQLIASPSATFIEKAVSGGLPRNALRHVAQTLVGDDKARVFALEWDVVPKTTLDRRKSRLSVGESERTERIARLFVHARRALGTDGEAREFMTTPHPELEGRSPLEVAATDLGTRRAEQILNALEYGLAL